jgi:hypothetical protein
MKRKLLKMFNKGHIEREFILALMNFFAVTKGENDIRMVFDGTKSGLNDALWAPWFALPTVDTTLRKVVTGTWMGDDDFGEMFYNFWLHHAFRPYTGIDLTELIPELKEHGGDTCWVRWVRPAMGLKPSPYQAVQGALRAKRKTLGNPKDTENVFQWKRVKLNLPGTKNYDPSLPWILKIRADGTIAADIDGYVDDLRLTAPTKELAWQASARIAKICSYLGLQIAPRKKRGPEQLPGAWQGAIVASVPHPIKTVSQDRWDKVKAKVMALKLTLEEANSTGMPAVFVRKGLESDRSHLVYISRVYKTLVPNLKGIHLTIDGFRPDRDEDGWRITNADDVAKLGLDTEEEVDIPKFVTAVPRMKEDVDALAWLMKEEKPPRIPVRPIRNAYVCFCFGDASGKGFGFSASIVGLPELEYDFGIWQKEFADWSSSNIREALNLLLKLEGLVDANKLPPGTEVFMFTDNFVTERAFWRGNSKGKDLFEVVFRLRVLEMKGALFLHIIWAAGTRMIEQGTDGLSRGGLQQRCVVG